MSRLSSLINSMETGLNHKDFYCDITGPSGTVGACEPVFPILNCTYCPLDSKQEFDAFLEELCLG